MALTLYLLRHADTLDKVNNQTDLERQLSSKGIKEAELIGEFLKEKKLLFNRLLVSHAVRAQQTAEIISRMIELPTEKFQTERTIYHSNPDGLMSLIRELSAADSHVGIVGHNPTISALADSLSLHPVGYFSTATVASITFDIEDWKAIQSKAGVLNFIKSP